MRFIETGLDGAYVIEPELKSDERGFFARSFCAAEFERHGLTAKFVQCNISHNKTRGTLRGLHYQAEPESEAKLIRCTRGAIFDVIVDLRPDSPTFGKWVSADLSAENYRMMFAPEGFAHGFQALADDTEVFYQMSRPYREALASGVRFDDPGLAIAWPIEDPIVSARDMDLPPLRAAAGRGAPRRAAGGGR